MSFHDNKSELNLTGHKQGTMARLHDSIKLYFILDLRHGEILNIPSTIDMTLVLGAVRRSLKCIKS